MTLLVHIWHIDNQIYSMTLPEFLSKFQQPGESDGEDDKV